MLAQRIKGKLDPLRPQKIFQRCDHALSRSYLGHGSGYTNEMKGKKEIKEALQWVGEHSEPAQNMKETGYAPIHSYSPELMQEIRLLWDDVIEDAPWRSIANQQISHPEEKFPLDKFLTEDTVNHFKAYYGTEIKIVGVLCWRNHGPHGEDRKQQLFSNWWHFDACSTALTKLFIAMSDITEDDGPFHVYDRQASNELIRQGYRDRRNYGNADVEGHKSLFRMTGKTGDALIANTQYCLHRAGVPKEGHTRDLIQFQIEPSHEPFDIKDWKKHLIHKGVDR